MVTRTAQLIATWQRVGFVHGMMNTDNQSIAGLTLDLGAAQVLPNPSPEFVASRLDTKGRYAFGELPTVGRWNCNVLARTLAKLVPEPQLIESLRRFESTFLETLAL